MIIVNIFEIRKIRIFFWQTTLSKETFLRKTKNTLYAQLFGEIANAIVQLKLSVFSDKPKIQRMQFFCCVYQMVLEREHWY